MNSPLNEVKCLINQLDLITDESVKYVPSSYEHNKRVITSLFSPFLHKSYSQIELIDIILKQLSIIDNLYSTQLNNRTNYGLGELAEALAILADGSLQRLSVLFIDLASAPEENINNFIVKKSRFQIYTYSNQDDSFNLFDKKYGLDKNGRPGRKAVSLITKYAYYLTSYQFPIYDSHVRTIAPKLWKYCNSFENPISISIKPMAVHFITEINRLKKRLDVSYDNLDRFLWYTGKIKDNNLSLLVNMNDYQHYAGRSIHSDHYSLVSIILDIFSFAHKLNNIS